MQETQKLTSAAISKMIRNLNEEKELILTQEFNSSVYDEVQGYQVIIPDYSFQNTQEMLEQIDEEVRKLKHALNMLNTGTRLEHFNMTVDEALVYMAQLNSRKQVLDEMRKRPQKSRKKHHGYGDVTNLVEYTCANYDIEEADRKYRELQRTINQLQMDIDYINQTKRVDV